MTKAVSKKEKVAKVEKVKKVVEVEITDTKPVIKVDIVPVNTFSYSQISNHKFEFALVNKENKLVHTPFQCKDYFQDIFWTEFTQKSGSAHGLLWKPNLIDVTEKTFRFAINGGALVMEDKIDVIEAFLNKFDSALGFELSKVYPTTSKYMIIIEFSSEWVQMPPLLSAFTTLIRLSSMYKIGEDVKEYLAFLISHQSDVFPHMNVEIGRLTNTRAKLLALLQNKKPTYTWDKIQQMMSAHNLGIMNDNSFPTVPV